MSDEYQVQQILKKRRNNNRVEYLIKWVGYSVEESTWEPVKNLKYVKNMIKQYDEKNLSYFDEDQSEKSKSRDSSYRIEYESIDQASIFLRDPSEDKSAMKAVKKEEGTYKRKRNVEWPKECATKNRRYHFYKKNEDDCDQQSEKEAKTTVTSVNSVTSEPSQEKDKQKQKHNDNEKEKETDKKRKQRLQIIGMRYNSKGELTYHVVSKDSGLHSFKYKEAIIENYAKELVAFYEKNLVLEQL